MDSLSEEKLGDTKQGNQKKDRLQITMSYKFILDLKYKIESETSTNITKLATIKQTNSTEL